MDAGSQTPGATGGGVCARCGTAQGPHATVTSETGEGQVRHQLLCQPCAATAQRLVPRVCVRCAVLTTAPVVVSEVHQNSGPGFSVYACPDCAAVLPPTPDVFTLLPAPEDGR